MVYNFKLVDIGEGIVEGEISKWFVKKGDNVKENQPLVEVITEKVTVELPSPVNGKIIEVGPDSGEIIKVGETIVIIDDGSETETNQEIQKLPETESQIKNELKNTNLYINNFKEFNNITKEMSNLENQQLQKENRWLELIEMEETVNN